LTEHKLPPASLFLPKSGYKIEKKDNIKPIKSIRQMKKRAGDFKISDTRYPSTEESQI